MDSQKSYFFPLFFIWASDKAKCISWALATVSALCAAFASSETLAWLFPALFLAEISHQEMKTSSKALKSVLLNFCITFATMLTHKSMVW